jgi:hypothetical protein
MLPFRVAPRWYDKYWYGDHRPHRSRDVVVRLLVVIALVSGSSLVLGLLGR